MSVRASTKLGIILLLVACGLLVRLFWYPAKAELGYTFRPSSTVTDNTPVDSEFGVVIPAISANSSIIADVDPYDSAIYQQALSRGVAHAQGTGKPGEGRNIFLFAHSSGDLITANRFNSIFYLLHHLESGDRIIIWYQNQAHPYKVTGKKLVEPGNLSPLMGKTTGEQLTLMTCWPPGTSLQRLIVTAIPSL